MLWWCHKWVLLSARPPPVSERVLHSSLAVSHFSCFSVIVWSVLPAYHPATAQLPLFLPRASCAPPLLPPSPEEKQRNVFSSCRTVNIIEGDLYMFWGSCLQLMTLPPVYASPKTVWASLSLFLFAAITGDEHKSWSRQHRNQNLHIVYINVIHKSDLKVPFCDAFLRKGKQFPSWQENISHKGECNPQFQF